MMLSTIANSSLKLDSFRNLYRRERMILLIELPGLIASGTCIAGHAGLLLGGHTILSGIANSSFRVDCFRNLYRRVRRVTAR